MRDTRVAVIQMGTGLQVDENIETALGLLDQLAEHPERPDLVCLPEMLTFRALGARPTAEVAVPAGHRLAGELSERARRLGSYLVAGWLVTDEHGRVHNETRVFDRAGRLAGLHRKSHLFDAPGHDESAHVQPGSALTVVDADFGTFGIVVCYELRFPEVTRTLALAGAEILVVPNSWPGDGSHTGENDLSVLLAAAAVQNQATSCTPTRSARLPTWSWPGAAASSTRGVVPSRGRDAAPGSAPPGSTRRPWPTRATAASCSTTGVPSSTTPRRCTGCRPDHRRRPSATHPRPALPRRRSTLHAHRQILGCPPVGQNTERELRDAARRCLQRYMELCDVPAIRYDRRELTALFAPDAVWQGGGRHNAAKFGEVRGADDIVSMLERYLPPNDHFRVNMHLLDRGTLRRTPDGGRPEITGRWTMMRLSTYATGATDLTLTGLRVEFAVHSDRVRITRYEPTRRWSRDIDQESAQQMFAAFTDGEVTEKGSTPCP